MSKSMIKKMAVDKFLWKNGEKRLNCAQTILGVFQDKFEVKDETIKLFSQYGGGRASEGLCGAYYAAVCLLNDNSFEKIEEFKKEFVEALKSNKCRELKANKISCIQCIEFCVEFLEKGK